MAISTKSIWIIPLQPKYPLTCQDPPCECQLSGEQLGSIPIQTPADLFGFQLPDRSDIETRKPHEYHPAPGFQDLYTMQRWAKMAIQDSIRHQTANDFHYAWLNWNDYGYAEIFAGYHWQKIMTRIMTVLAKPGRNLFWVSWILSGGRRRPVARSLQLHEPFQRPVTKFGSSIL